MKRAVCLALLLVLLSGCSRKITSGEVIEKSFTPAHSSVMMIPVVRTIGKVTSTTIIPYVYHYSDRYIVKISGYNKDGERDTASYRVEKAVFETVELGDEFEYVDEMKPDYPEYTRVRQSADQSD
jgi:hypothetical protein